MKLSRSLLKLALALMIPVLSYAQDGGPMIITGTVDNANDYHMPNVVIRLNDYYFVTATTDSSGQFTMIVDPAEISATMNEDVDINDLRLTANIDGYYPQTKVLKYAAGSSAEFVFELKPLSQEDAQDNNGNNHVISVAAEPVEEEGGEPVGSVL